METWLELFRKESTPQEVAGNRPLLLDDPDRVWMVVSGRVDVFAVPFQNSVPAGIRIHLYRAETGQLLLGCPCGPAGSLGLLAVGIPGSQVLSLPRGRLQELGGDPAELDFLLGEWVEGLTARVAQGRQPGRAALLTREGESFHPAGASVTPALGMLWISAAETTCRFLGKVDVPLSGPESAFPLASSGWLELPGQARLQSTRSASSASDPCRGRSLAGFHRAVLACVDLNAQEDDAAELARLQQKAASEDRLARSALARLAAVVEPRRNGSEAVPEQEAPVLAACRLVGQQMGVTIRTPRDFGKRTCRDPIGAIARASGIRTRRVALTGDWWRRDNGPLLAFRGQDNQPVALLPVSASRYVMVDPGTQIRVPVTRAAAAGLQPFAHCFYRSFPSRAMTARDIVEFAVAGTCRDWLAVVLLGLAGGLLGMLIPIATGVLFGQVIPDADEYQLGWLVGGLTVTAVVTTLFELVRGIATLRLETRMNCSVEAAVWDRLLNLPATFFRQYATGDLAMRAMGITRIRQVLTDAVMSSVLVFLFSLVSFALLFYLDVRLAILATLLFAIVAGVTCWAALVQLHYEKQNYEVRGKVASIVLQLLTGISRLRIAGAENRALAFWAESFSRRTKLSVRAQAVANHVASFMSCVPLVSACLIFAAVSFLEESLSLATYLAFNAAFVQVVTSGVAVSSAVTSILGIVPLYQRAKPILLALPEFDRSKRDPGELAGGIEIDHVSFRYYEDGPLVLDDVSLHVRPGEFVAFAGPSGAGKSTILRLLLGFEAPTAGSIYFDREDLAGLDHQAVRSQIGVVLQNSQLSPGSLLDNIRGSSAATLDEAWEAACLSGLDQDIREMPMGMYTVITEGESTLSGGQKQRLLIARAVVSRPRILLFDEATSALDNITQAKVAESLERLKATRIVVAHRLSTVIHADRICVVDRGKIVQQGSYQQLLELPGLFAELARRQLV